MALDLTLCIVPPQVDTIISKAKNSFAYAEWTAFIPGILMNGPLESQRDPMIRAMNADVLQLKKHYHYSPGDDYLYDANRVSASLDYVLDIIAAKKRIELRQLLRKGGTDICGHCKAVQGHPVKLYHPEDIESVSAFLQKVSLPDITLNYDYHQMVRHGVYKPTAPADLPSLVSYFGRVQKLFARAHIAGMPVLKVID